MPQQLSCAFEELDDATRDYLLAVHRANGRGAPGVYVNQGNALPFFAVLLGPVIAVGTVAYSLTSPKDPAAVAMLQTAGVLLGGWMFVYAFRRWAAAGTPRYPGVFRLFDPLHVYEVNGESVRVTSLDDVNGVEAVPGDNAQVRFTFDGDKRMSVGVPNAKVAGRVEDYYDGLDQLESKADGPWAAATDAARGAAALHYADEDEFPRDTGDIRLDWEEIPAEPAKANKPSGGAAGVLAIPAAALLLFLLFWPSNRFVGDDLAFENAKHDGAPGLRGYLLDERNTRHRDEARTLLAAAYDPAVARVRGAPPGQRPELRAGMAQLIDSLRTADQAVLSIRVAGATNPPNPGTDAVMAREIADSLARTIGPDLVMFATPADGKPAHVEVAPNAKRTGLTITLRTAPDAAPVASADFAPPPGPDATRNAICVELVGAYTFPPPVVQDGDF